MATTLAPVRTQFRPQEAADYLGISRTKLYALIRDKKLRKTKLGKRTSIKKSECDRLIDQNTRYAR